MIIRYIKLALVLCKMKLAKDMIYSINFWIAFFVDSILFIFQIVAFASIYRFTESINGWTLPQMIIFIGTFTIVDSLNMATYFFGVISLPDKIKSGMLDTYIVKPIDTQFYVSLASFNPGSLLGVIVGVVMVTYGMKMGSYPLSLEGVLGYGVLVILMYLLMYALLLIIRACAFIFIKIDAVAMAEDSLVEFAFRIPGSAFRGVFKWIFMVIIPYGLIATVPAYHITTLLGMSEWAFVVVITVVFLSLARVLFQYGLRKYTSASS